MGPGGFWLARDHGCGCGRGCVAVTAAMAWMCSFVGVCMCVCVGVWMYGCMGMWMVVAVAVSVVHLRGLARRPWSCIRADLCRP